MIISRCGCGKKYDVAEWRALPMRGVMWSGVPGVNLELRDCSCLSTISARVKSAGDVYLPWPEPDGIPF